MGEPRSPWESLESMQIALMIAAALSLSPLAPSFTEAGAPPVFEERFETGAAGWNATGLWAVSTLRAGSPTHAFHYAIEREDGTSTYDTGAPNRGELMSPPIDLTGLSTAKASFWTWWRGEGTCSWEHPLVYAQVANGTRHLVREMCEPSGVGVYEANLTPFVGQPVHLVFVWDTKDSYQNDLEGWYIDDVVVAEGNASLPQFPPDLIPTQLSIQAPTPWDDTTIINATVENRGASPVNSSFSVVFRLDGAVLSVHEVPAGMGAGHAITLSTTTNFSAPGWHSVTVEADAFNDVGESNETNNIRERSFYVAARGVDLFVSDLVAGQTTYGGDRAPFVFRWGNAGTEPTTENSSIIWTLDGVEIERSGLPPGMPAGWNLTSAQWTPPLSPGVHEIAVIIDPDGNITQITTANDRASIIVEVLPNPDITIRIPSLDRIPADEGDPTPRGRHRASVQLCNEGETTASDVLAALFVKGRNGTTPGLGADTIDRYSILALAPGACRTDTVEFDVPQAIGDFTLVASASAPHEVDLSNNVAEAESWNFVEGHGGIVVASGLGTILEPSEAPIRTLTTAVREPATAIDITEATLCSSPSTAGQCESTRGDLGLGATRPCRTTPPANNLLGQLLWEGVQTYERRSLDRPGAVPGSLWPLPNSTPLPIPDEAPHLCHDMWDTLRESAR